MKKGRKKEEKLRIKKMKKVERKKNIEGIWSCKRRKEREKEKKKKRKWG